LLPFRFLQELNAVQANVFQKLLAKYRAGKVQYQDLKKKLEELSDKLGIPLLRKLCYRPFCSHISVSRFRLAQCFA
jgi:nitric oxide reductase activation protein